MFETIRIHLDTLQSDGEIRGYNHTYVNDQFVFYVTMNDGTQKVITEDGVTRG